MYPEEGPAEDCESSAERTLYYRLREALSAEYHVIHSAKWNAVAANGRMQAGEADFIIIHPHKGILVLEVKGGRVHYDPRAGRWYVLDRFDRKDRIRDPFTQAMASVKILERKLRAVPRTRAFAPLYRCAYGVWFPDMSWPRGAGGEMRMLDEQVLDRADLDQPEHALERLFRFAQGNSPAPALSDEAMDALLSLLAPDLTRAESPLSQVIAGESALMERLTGEQFAHLFVMWQSHRQLAVPGHAGTGKTMIAMEMAWRLAQSGSHVLLLCANPTLAQYLQNWVKADPRPQTAELQIRSLRELTEDIAIDGGRRLAEVGRLDASEPADQRMVADILTENLDILAARGQPRVFDAILVDEAQDLDKPLWPLLRRMLRPTDSPETASDLVTSEASGGTTAASASHFYAFYDPEQRLAHGEWDAAWTGLPVLEPPLSMNCRNTRAVYEVMAALNEQLRTVPFIGPAGRPIWCHDPHQGATVSSYTDGARRQAETAALERVLDELIGRQGMRAEQILVITCRSQVAGSANATGWLTQEQRSVGRYDLQALGPRRAPGKVAFATIRSAKGLEALVVVLAELDGVQRDPRRRRLLYTAVSRAKHHLVVLGAPDSLVPVGAPTEA